MDKNSKFLLEQIADLHSIPQTGVYSVRENGKVIAKNTDEQVDIISKTDKEGINIIVKPHTKNKSMHLPVLVSASGFEDVVYNDFYIGDDCEIMIVAGCGIHNPSALKSSHNGIHRFHIGKNCKVKYVEKHFAFGNKTAEKILSPVTNITVGEGSEVEMETLQLGGVTYANRQNYAKLKKNAKLIIRENILTTDNQFSKSNFKVIMKENGARVEVISRSVAKDQSKQLFNSSIEGEAECFGHVECDGILCDNASVASTPKIVANNPNAMLTHEASIGKISEEQQNKLMSLGLTKQEAEQQIINGFLQ